MKQKDVKCPRCDREVIQIIKIKDMPTQYKHVNGTIHFDLTTDLRR